MKKQTKKEALLKVFQNIELLVVPRRKLCSSEIKKPSKKDKLIYEQVHIGVMLLSK